ncbi:effector-associated constant component EACC1 [Streptomyces sp. NTH33]|uniref:effector-associated constant component EACC1 n=1 Tax=Streptomyces sp. NTH33 TaxID=1735453 RepID=UPI0011B935D5
MDLYEWLTRDPDVLRVAEPVLALDDEPDTLGGLEVIEFAVSNVMVFANLLVAIASWRDGRSPGAEVCIERDGVTLRVEHTDPEDARRMFEQLTGTHEPDGRTDESHERRPDDEAP